MRLFHIAERALWEEARARGVYVAPSLEAEGFIHLSRATQWREAFERFYRDRDDMVLLWLVPEAADDIRYERADGADYPHLYSALNVDRVIRVSPLELAEDGAVIEPAELSEWLEFFLGPARVIATSDSFDALVRKAHPEAKEHAMVAVRNRGEPEFYLCLGAREGYEGRIRWKNGAAYWKRLPDGIDRAGWLQLGAFPRREDGSLDERALLATVQRLIVED